MAIDERLPGPMPVATRTYSRLARMMVVVVALASVPVVSPAMATALDSVGTAPAAPGMVAMTDDDMDAIHAQGLFWSDKIGGSELTGPNAYSTPFTFYRVGLDADLALNMNIGKLQLGCGGVNDFLNAKAGCDIDIDYASLMGRNGVEPGNPLSAFTLRRPYLEFAVKNDGTANREIVGIKIGTQSADGAIVAGRRYETNGAVNQENMLSNGCDTGASVGVGALGCHSGINSVSGFLGSEMSLSMRVKARICGSVLIGGVWCGITNLLWVPLDAWGCIGRTQTTNDNCGTANSDALFIDLAGTRMDNLGLQAAKLNLEGNGLSGILTAFLDSAYASLNADLRLVHKLTLEDTGDFFLSFQREPVAYPRFSKMTPAAELPSGAMDSCKSTNFSQARCASAYAVPANTGWWLNLPSVKLLDVYNDNANIGNLNINDALALLAAPGYLIDQAEFEMTPSRNCYGATRFC